MCFPADLSIIWLHNVDQDQPFFRLTWLSTHVCPSWLCRYVRRRCAFSLGLDAIWMLCNHTRFRRKRNALLYREIEKMIGPRKFWFYIAVLSLFFILFVACLFVNMDNRFMAGGYFYRAPDELPVALGTQFCESKVFLKAFAILICKFHLDNLKALWPK